MVKRERLKGPLTAVLALTALVSAAACSMLNREGPTTSCADLKAGTINACKEGIIATCATNGTKVEYNVCTEDIGTTSAEKICEANWQVPGKFQCAPPTGSTSGGAASSGSSGSSSGNGSTSSGSSGSSDGGKASACGKACNGTLQCMTVNGRSYCQCPRTATGYGQPAWYSEDPSAAAASQCDKCIGEKCCPPPGTAWEMLSYRVCVNSRSANTTIEDARTQCQALWFDSDNSSPATKALYACVIKNDCDCFAQP